MMLKKLLCLMLAVLLLLPCLIACGKDAVDPAESGTDTAAATEPAQTTPPADGSGAEPKPEPEPGKGDGKEEDGSDATALNANTKGLRLLGERTVATATQINCDHTGSGIELVVNNEGDTLTFRVESNKASYFRVYVDGTAKSPVTGGTYFEVNGKGMISLSGLSKGQHTIRVIKVTDAAKATAQITAMICTGSIVETTVEEQELFLEFVGGGILAGEGLIGNGSGYSSEDGTLGYGYRIAQAMEADYSIVADPTLALCGGKDASVLYGYACANRDTAAHDFTRKADVVVIDLGTADRLLSASDETVTVTAFAEKYQALLETIRAKNGEACKIVCVYNDADGAYARAIQSLCTSLGGQREGYYSCQMTMGSDGVLSAEEQTSFETLLKTVIDNASRGVITEREMTSETGGDGLSISYNDFITL